MLYSHVFALQYKEILYTQCIHVSMTIMTRNMIRHQNIINRYSQKYSTYIDFSMFLSVEPGPKEVAKMTLLIVTILL